MSTTSQSCLWCRVGRYWYGGSYKKFFVEPKLCFDCATICELNVQMLVPASERHYGNSNTTYWPRGAYKSNYLKTGNGDKFGCLARSNRNNWNKWYK